MFFRSIIFYLLIYLWTLLLGLLFLPYLILKNSNIRKLANLWTGGIIWLLKLTCGITYEILGEKNIPNHPVIVAAKHQSTFETFLLFKLINNSFILGVCQYGRANDKVNGVIRKSI